MKLFINYLYRELRQVPGEYRRSPVNDAQVVFGDYVFEVEFNPEGIPEEDFKQSVGNTLIDIYQRRDEDTMTRFAHPSDQVNCVAFRFEDEDENYGEGVFRWRDNRGWKFYNFPPFGVNRERNHIGFYKVDPRVFIDGLLRTEGIGDAITNFSIRYENEKWTFRDPFPLDAGKLGADYIEIDKPLPDNPQRMDFYRLSETKFIFPYADSFDNEEEINTQVTDFTTLFAILLEGKMEYMGDPDVYENVNNIIGFEQFTTENSFCSVKEEFRFRPGYRYVSPDEIMFIISGEYSKTLHFSGIYGQNEWEDFYDYEGDFYSGRIHDLIFDICPLAVVSDVCVGSWNGMNKPDEDLSVEYADYEKIPAMENANKKEPWASLYGQAEEDVRNFESARSAAQKYVKLNLFRSNKEVKRFENQLWEKLKAYENDFEKDAGWKKETCDLNLYDLDAEGNFSALVNYTISKKTVLKVLYTANRFFLEGISIGRITIDSRVGAGLHNPDCRITVECSINNSTYEILERDVNVSLKLQEMGITRDFLEEVLTRKNCDIPYLLDFLETLEKEVEKVEKEKIKIRTAGTGKSDNKILLKNNSTLNYENKNPKLESLREYLRYNNNLSFSENTFNEIGRVFVKWLPVMDTAREKSVSVKEYIRNGIPSKQIPGVPNLAIMGEAGTGKTTMARILAENCLGAEIGFVIGEELKGMYIGWTKAVLAGRIYAIQKNLKKGQPGILFIDEAYSIFEEERTGTKGAKNVVEFLLKICEPGEYDIELGDARADDLEGMGLSFRVTQDQLNLYSDRDLYKCLRLVDDNGNTVAYQITLKKVKKQSNLVIWIGGYEDRLRRAFLANEGLNRRFSSKIIIPSPRMDELIKLFKNQVKEKYGEETANAMGNMKDVRDFLMWATSKSRSHLFGNYAGVIELVKRFEGEFYFCDEKPEMASLAALNAASRYKTELEKQYKTELTQDVKELPFEVVTSVDMTLEDYAGNERLKRRIEKIIDIMMHKEEYQEQNISLPKGALLMGPPGTGKTMIARCMAGQLQEAINREADKDNLKDVAFIPTSGAELLAGSNPVNMIKALFAEASSYDAAVIFIDEIDAIGKKRHLQSNIGPLTQLMKEMDGFGTGGNIFVMAATNDPDILEPALVRDNRLDIRLEVGLPDKSTSISLIRHYLENYRIDYDNLDTKLKIKTLNYLGGMVPASVRANLNEAAILYHQSEKMMKDLSDEEIEEKFSLELAHRRREDGGYLRTENYDGRISDFELFLRDLKETIDIKAIGARTEADDEEEEFTTDNPYGESAVAIHEVGHALVGLTLGCLNIERITILGRGDARGYVERKSMGVPGGLKCDLLNSIKVTMGGRVAEELIYGPGNVSDGARADIQNAFFYAERMVTIYGFSDKIGFMGVGEIKSSYLDNSIEYKVSDNMRYEADKEIQAILDACMEETRKILKENKDLLITISRQLFELKEITGETMEKIYKEEKGLK